MQILLIPGAPESEFSLNLVGHWNDRAPSLEYYYPDNNAETPGAGRSILKYLFPVSFPPGMFDCIICAVRVYTCRR